MPIMEQTSVITSHYSFQPRLASSLPPPQRIPFLSIPFPEEVAKEALGEEQESDHSHLPEVQGFPRLMLQTASSPPPSTCLGPSFIASSNVLTQVPLV